TAIRPTGNMLPDLSAVPPPTFASNDPLAAVDARHLSIASPNPSPSGPHSFSPNIRHTPRAAIFNFRGPVTYSNASVHMPPSGRAGTLSPSATTRQLGCVI